MNSIILLAIISFALFLFVMRQTKGELLSCSSLTLSAFSVSCILLYVQALSWGIEISDKTVYILSWGLLALTSADLLAYKKYRKVHLAGWQPAYTYMSIRYSNGLIAIYVLMTLLYAREIMLAGASLGYSDLSAIGEVKGAAIEEGLGDQINPYIRQFYKIVTASGYLHALLFANNFLLAKSPLRKEFKHLIPLFCVIVITLASGGRLNIFETMVGFVFIYYVVLRESSQWRKRYLRKLFKVGLPLFLGFTLLFSAVQLIVKSNAQSRERVERMEYISYYAGSPILVFDIKAKDGQEKWSYGGFGRYTFSGLYKIAKAERDAKADYIGNGMVYLGGDSGKAGNAMTIFGGFYFDFGLVGMCVALFILYFFMGRYYYRNILNTRSSYVRNKRLIIYTYCYVLIIAMAFYDNCFWVLLSTTGLLTLCVLVLMYWVYFRKLLTLKVVRTID